MSRMSIELTEEQHRKIKVYASLQGKSIKEVVVENLFKNIDKKFNKNTLKAIKEVQIDKNLNSYKNVNELFQS